ncbi:MAG: DUF475 domain-containing protein [Pseudomonadota bacterium]
MRDFHFSNICTIIGLILAYMWIGWDGVFIAAILILMEVSLSFDNAVVNATILKTMSEKWRKRFMTWGILIAVFGMRLVFPVLLVSFATGLSMYDVSHLAFKDPDEYSKHVLGANVEISLFGGMFLLMVFMHFIFDESKEVHWIGFLERRLSAAGRLKSLEVIIAITILLVMQALLPEQSKLSGLTSGLVGVVLYITINSIMSLFSVDGHQTNKSLGVSGFVGFMYLQLLDASFSLDGVIGAFAISKDVVIIMIGLGVGAIFVRSMTIYMVKRKTLDEYVFLEHGAHYGIGALALIMLANSMHHISEVITGLIGLVCILLSWWSSVKFNKINNK